MISCYSCDVIFQRTHPNIFTEHPFFPLCCITNTKLFWCLSFESDSDTFLIQGKIFSFASRNVVTENIDLIFTYRLEWAVVGIWSISKSQCVQIHHSCCCHFENNILTDKWTFSDALLLNMRVPQLTLAIQWRLGA